MRLLVCWGTFPLPLGHPCQIAHQALRDAGHDPKVELAFGHRLVPDVLSVTPGRREAKRRTGKTDVPVLILDDDTSVAGTRQIVRWAKANRA